MFSSKFLGAVRAFIGSSKYVTNHMSKTPLLYCEPGVLTGYRLQHQPIKYYVNSMLQVHNETLNIWSHLIACLLVVIKTYCCLQELEDPGYAPVILCFGVCCMAYTFLSTLAHTIHSKSPTFHYTCYQLDYMGIGYYALGSCILGYYTGCHKDYYKSTVDYFLPTVVVMSWCGFVCCTISKLRYRRPYPFRRKMWNVCSFGLQCVVVFSVVLARYYDCLQENTLWKLNHHTKVALYILSSVIFFSSHIPEKFSPGTFDLLGQGHQIFHVLSSIGTLEQFNAAMIDIRDHTILLPNKPMLSSILCSFLAYTILALLTLKWFRCSIKNRVEKDSEIEKSRRHYD